MVANNKQGDGDTRPSLLGMEYVRSTTETWRVGPLGPQRMVVRGNWGKSGAGLSEQMMDGVVAKLGGE